MQACLQLHRLGMFLPFDPLEEYLIDLFAMELSCIGFTFPTRI